MNSYDFFKDTDVFGLTPVMLDDKWGLTDKQFREVVGITLDCAPVECGNFIKCNRNGKFGLYDREGTLVFPIIYDEIQAVSKFEFIVTINDKKGVKDFLGKQLLDVKYDSIRQMTEKYYAIVNNGKVGLVNEKFNIVIPTIYKRIRVDNSKIVTVINSQDKEGLFDLEKQKLLCAPKWDYIGSFNKGYAPIRDSKRAWGYIDENGRQIVDCKYKRVQYFEHGYTAVQDFNEFWGYVNRDGAEVTRFIYQSASAVSEDGVAIVIYNHEPGRIYLKPIKI